MTRGPPRGGRMPTASGEPTILTVAMLSKDLALFSVNRGRAVSDRLTRKTHVHYTTLATRLIELYRHGAGRTREELHRAAETVFADQPDCPPQRVRALVRLLDQASEYQTDREGRATALRQRVFELAAARHPLVSVPDALFQHDEREVKEAIAAVIGRPWADIEAALYNDLPAFHRLVRLEGFTEPEDLLRRYNVAQAQALLFWAEAMTVVARGDFKRLFRRAKLAGLLHEIEAIPGDKAPAYRIRFTGPASMLRETRRYGIHMAAFLPTLLACRDWSMSARLRLPRGVAVFELSPDDRLQSHLGALEAFDSKAERAFAEKFGAEREGWKLEREGDFLVRHQKVFVPDFTFRHEDGTVAYLEIVGFWTPEYLAAKAKTLALFADTPIIIAAARSVADKLPPLPGRVIPYTTRLKLKPVLEALGSMHPRRAQVRMSRARM